MIVRDAFFSFNDFEHCQDSFLGWLFNDYFANSELAKRIAKRLLFEFSGLDLETEVREIKKLKATPQPSKGITADILVTFELGADSYAVFIEDKTKAFYSKSQIKKTIESMSKLNLDPYKSGRAWNRSYVFYSTNQCQSEIKEENKVESCRYFLLNRILKIFKEEFEKSDDDAKHGEWILNTYFGFLNGDCKTLQISATRGSTFKNLIEEELEEESVSILFNTIPNLEYPCPKDYVEEVVVSPKERPCDYELVLHLKKLSKREPLIRVFSRSLRQNKKAEEAFLKSLGVNKSFRKVPNHDIRSVGIKVCYADIDAMKGDIKQKINKFVEALASTGKNGSGTK